MKTLVLLIAIVLSACAKPAATDDSAIIRGLVQAEMPSASSTDHSLEAASKLVSFIHFKTIVKNTDDRFANATPSENLRLILTDPTYGLLRLT